MFVLYFCFCIYRKFQSFDFRSLLDLGLLAPFIILIAARGGGRGGYGSGGDARLTGAGSQDARIGEGLYLPLGD